MGFRFHKQFRRGPFRVSVTKKGAGVSVGSRGFRVGRSADGRYYVSVGVPGTGFYHRKTFGSGRRGPRS